MAIKDLLVHLDTTGVGDNVSDYAVSLAAELRSHLTAAGLALQLVPPSSFMGEYPYDLMLEATESAQKAAEEAYQRMRNAAPAGVETELVMIKAVPGEARNEFARLARHFDMAIVGQGGSDYGSDDELMAEGALFRSGRPMMVVPRIHKGPARLGKAMACWDGGMAAARAIADAMPLLKHSRSVELVSVAAKKLATEELPGFNITRHLARHGVNATLRKLPHADDIGSCLLSYAADSGADYMVMGGYGHSRFREFVLGGTTRTLFASMTVPVMMSH
jgi:nucleotide-binding universal stress UspA family protein